MGLLLQPENLRVFLLGEAALFFLLCGGFLLNDVLDLKYDLINRPQTVYIGRDISQRLAVILGLLLFASSLLCAFLAGRAVPWVVMAQMLALVVYDLFSKRMSYFKPVFMAALFVTIYPLSLAIAGGGVPCPRRDSLYIFPVWLFLTVLSYEWVTDARDRIGDALDQTSGFTRKFGAKTMLNAGRILTCLALPIALIPYLLGQCHEIYLAGVIIAAVALASHLILKKIDFVAVLHAVVISIVLSSLLDVIFRP
jgi:4-hydroxybenzoate polyprenyltransferase